MALYISGLLISLFIIDLTMAKWTPAGTAQSFTFTSPNITQTFPIVWYTYPQKSKLFICTENNATCVPFTNNVLETYTANKTSDSTSYISTFTIKTVTPLQHNSSWLCQAEFQDEHIDSMLYNLKVFAVPESPTCDKVSLLNESAIKINCMTNKVFPGGICAFYIITNNTSPYELKNGQISYTREYDNSTGYYSTNCTYIMSANFVGPGTHNFHVAMYPDISSNISEEMKRTSDYTTPITIGYPEARLQQNCKINDHIPENDTGRCTCYDNNINFLTSHVTWSTQAINNNTLEFIAKRGLGSFNCTISNGLNWISTITFHPDVSYPPDSVNLTLYGKDLDICNGANVTISGICLVSESNPKPSVYLNISNTVEKISTSIKTREHLFNITKKSVGFFYVSCFANVTGFSSISSNGINNFTIKGPPEKPIIFKSGQNNARDILEVRNGDAITCQSKGGFPLSKNISLKCGKKEVQEPNQDEVQLKINISNNVVCHCNLEHESKCLPNGTTVQLKFLETPSDPDQDFKSIYIGVGVAVCCVVIFIAVILVMSKTGIGDLKWCSRSIYEELVNNEELYFIQKEKSFTDMSLFQDYTNVVTTMKSAMELPKNLAKMG